MFYLFICWILDSTKDIHNQSPYMLFRVPARMVVRRPAPINQLFNDESIAVQI